MSQRAYAYKARLRPAQERAALEQLELHRRLYNAALEARSGAYNRVRWRMKFGTAAERAALRATLPTYVTQNRELTLIRRDDPAYAAMASSCEQRTLRRLDKAFAAFFRRVAAGETPGYPRFKRKGAFTSLEWTAGNGARVAGNRAYFQGIGSVRLRLYRPLPAGGVVKAIWLVHRASGWWVICSVQQPDAPAPPKAGPAVGLDVGLRHYVMASDGQSWDWPRSLEQALARLRVLQRKQARQQRGSAYRRETEARIARLHEHIANQRREFQRLLARDLCAAYAHLDVEDLRITEMARNERYTWARHWLNRGIYDAAWRQLLDILALRAGRDGVTVVAHDPANTTQACSRCGQLVPKTIFERVHRCPHCRLVLDADHNAAINLAVEERRRLE